MTATAERPAPTDPAGATGRIVRVTGPVVDVEFPGDAIPDIIIPAHNQRTFMVLRGTGTSTFFSAPDVYDTQGKPYGIAVADFDGDGRQDISLVDNANMNVNVHMWTSCP